MSKESSITVAVRVRPLSRTESQQLGIEKNILDNYDTSHYPSTNSKLPIRRHEVRKILDVIDDRMLVFDPKPSSSLRELETNSISSAQSNRSHFKRRINSNIGTHNKRNREHRFIFDRLFDEPTTQQDIYEFTTRPLLDSVMEGYNSTIFAYGATGCGKTYTISGTSENPGLIFLAMEELFDRINDQSEKEVSISVSYLEIYNETIKDLLNPETNPHKLTLLEDEHKQIVVTNLSTITPVSVQEVMDIIVLGNSNRTVSPTEANATSSRSHAVLQVHIFQKPLVSDVLENHTRSTLSIIDLAGSERASATKNKGARLHEGANINKSLLALGNCINALCDPKRCNHIPYRDSKLTRLLKFSLGGNCKTVMIVCISPSSRHYDETLNALKYANRAKEIKTKIVRNRTSVVKHVGSYLKIISDQKREIEELKKREGLAIERELEKFKSNRDKCLNELWNTIDRLWQSVEKCLDCRSDKAYILAKRKIVLVILRQIEDFQNSLVRWDPNEQIKSIHSSVAKLILNLQDQIKFLEEEYLKVTELDQIVVGTSRSLLRKLKELDEWNERDEVVFDREIGFLKESVERMIYLESSLLFDKWMRESDSVEFISDSLLRCLVKLENCATTVNSIEEARIQLFDVIDKIVKLCLDSINKLANNHERRKRKTSSPNSKRLSSSPIKYPFIKKTNRLSSINNKLEDINLEDKKSVRWELPSSSNNKNDKMVSQINSNENIPAQDTTDSMTELESSMLLSLDDDFLKKRSSNQLRHASVDVPTDTGATFDTSLDRTPPHGSDVEACNRLTSKKLSATPKINSPSRLAGLGVNTGKFHIKLRESLCGSNFFENGEGSVNMDVDELSQ